MLWNRRTKCKLSIELLAFSVSFHKSGTHVILAYSAFGIMSVGGSAGQGVGTCFATNVFACCTASP